MSAPKVTARAETLARLAVHKWAREIRCEQILVDGTRQCSRRATRGFRRHCEPVALLCGQHASAAHWAVIVGTRRGGRVLCTGCNLHYSSHELPLPVLL